MRIPIDEIFPNPDIGTKEKKDYSKAHNKFKKNPVVLATDKGYVLLAGTSKITYAKKMGENDIECTVKENINEQEKFELLLSENYHSSLMSPMDLGESFIKYREKYNVTQQELARRTGITPGTIHHYESLIRTLNPKLGEALSEGLLTFKEARSIADLDDHDRQIEIAKPFLEGKLSSVYVEKIVGRAKVAISLSIDEIIDEVVNGKKSQMINKNESSSRFDRKVISPSTELIENSILKIAGELEALQIKNIPEYRRLKLISSLRILETRLKYSLNNLNGGFTSKYNTPKSYTSRVSV
ncbi:MAG: ParB/RepB/Spo0J family partition protein [Dehalococcoidia bacterium]